MALSKELGAFFAGWIFILLAAVQIHPAAINEHRRLLSPPQIQHLTFGLREQIADFFWLRAIQDFDYCEELNLKKQCQQKKDSWLYHMLDLITDLAQDFRMPYATGGLALTVVVNDVDGASRLFDKGVRQFPTDWPLLSRAAYHAMFEEKNKLKAADLMRRAARAGGPPWYSSLATKLLLEADHMDLAEELVRELESEDPQSLLATALRKKIADQLSVDSSKGQIHIGR